MLRLAFTLVPALAIACTGLPPAPGGTGGDAGEGGAGGTSGQGGDGGDGGSGPGGQAGSGAMGGSMPACTSLVPQPYNSLEDGDTVESGGFVLGKVSGVCPNQEDCTGDDPFDRWTFTGCVGAHSVEVWWDQPLHDLNLYVFSEGDQTIDQASEAAEGNLEVVGFRLDEELPLVIQVQANGTGGAEQSYCLEVVPPGADSGAERLCPRP